MAQESTERTMNPPATTTSTPRQGSITNSIPLALGFMHPRLIELEAALLRQTLEIDMPWAYFVQSGRYVKIGHSRSSEGLRQRLNAYRVAAPEGARLVAVSPGGEETERMLHRALRVDHARGEWFYASSRLLRVMRHEGLWPIRMTTGWPFRNRRLRLYNSPSSPL